jgi:lipopolysaccharide/colanic/teichoic acid biosynthesis glycosyltransferase
MVKRSFDVVSALIGLLVFGLPMLLVALWIRLDSPGPVFFRQERVGFLGRRFKIYKFRTMKVNADTANHQAYFKELVGTNAPMQKLDAKGDSRLIPLGWILRASGLDELPQVINVFRGEMSFVGPRPCLPAEYDLYLPWQRERFTTVPGLTGLWQVSGKNRTTFDQMIRFDIKYAQTKTLALDLRIIVSTPIALLTQIYDTRTGRKSSALNQTHPPMPMAQVRMPEVAGNR